VRDLPVWSRLASATTPSQCDLPNPPSVPRISCKKHDGDEEIRLEGATRGALAPHIPHFIRPHPHLRHRTGALLPTALGRLHAL
jgi:hypothetical protein